jgi:hypothetical protein
MGEDIAIDHLRILVKLCAPDMRAESLRTAFERLPRVFDEPSSQKNFIDELAYLLIDESPLTR